MESTERKELERKLQEKIKGDVSFNDVILGVYATDASIYQIKPVAVVLPKDEQDICETVRIAGEHKVSIVPRGGGTSLGGQAMGPGIIIDFTKYMNKKLELNVEEKWVSVQPGVILDELNADLAAHDLLFAPDPATGNRAAIGGMMGNNSSGTKSIIYGIMRDHVIECRFLLADGTILKLEELKKYMDEYRDL